jgi:hypothetical protein
MKNSTDVWFIAFLMHKNYEIKSFDKLPTKRVRCFFDIEESMWQKLKIEFNNSEIIKFKGLIEQIKDLAY